MQIKELELRATPTLKGLREERADLITEMEGIINKGKLENRDLSPEEKARFDIIESRIKTLDIEVRAIDINRNNDIKTTNKGKSLKTMENVVLPGQIILETRSYDGKNYDLGNLVRIMAGKSLETRGNEEVYYRAMATGGNSVIIPRKLADEIVDIARSQSAIFGQIPILQMDNNNMVVATVKSDAEASFVPEGELIPASQVIFEGVTLDGKTLALFVPVQEQLLDSASNLTSVLMNSCALAIANTLDSKLVYGDGVDEVKGIKLYDTINQVDHDKYDYNAIIKGIKGVKKNNITPTTIVYNTDLASDLAMLTDTTGQYITPPKALDLYEKRESNNILNDEILCYEMNSLLLGIHKNITIEWGTSTDMFQRIQKGLRVYLRVDLALVKPKGISLTTITTTP